MLNKEIAVDIPGIISVHEHWWERDELPFDTIGDILSVRLLRKGAEEIIEHLDSKEKEKRVKEFLKIFYLNDSQKIVGAQYDVYQELGLVGGPQTLAPRLYLSGLLMNFDHAGFKLFFASQDKFSSQIKHAYELARNSGHADLTCIPGLGIDPRDPRMEKRTDNHFKNNFNLFKLYPALGFTLYDKKLTVRFYPQLLESHGSVVRHGSPGGFLTLENPIKLYDLSKDKYKYKLFDGKLVPDFLDKPDKRTWLNDPSNDLKVLRILDKEYRHGGELYLNIAHLGGGGQLRKFIRQLEDPTIDVNKLSESEKTFTQKIIELCLSDYFPNVYTDISSTIGMGDELSRALEIILKHYPRMREKILFGVDDYILRTSHDFRTTIKTFFDYWTGTPERKALLRKFVWENPFTFLQGNIGQCYQN